MSSEPDTNPIEDSAKKNLLISLGFEIAFPKAIQAYTPPCVRLALFPHLSNAAIELTERCYKSCN